MTRTLFKFITGFLIVFMAVPFFGLSVVADEVISGSIDSFIEPERTVDYTDQLIDISDRGLFDVSGQALPAWKTDALPSSPKVDAPQESTHPASGDLGEYQQSVFSRWGSEKGFAQDRLKGIQDNLSIERNRFQELIKTVKELQSNVAPLQAKIGGLKDQIELFNQQIQDSQKSIEAVEQQVVQKQLTLRGSMNDLDISKVSISEKQKNVLEFISLMYHEEEHYFNLYDQGADTFKLFLADRSVSESLQGQEYLGFVESLGRDFYHQLQAKDRALQEKQNDLQKQRQELASLSDSLSSQKEQLKIQLVAKKELLDQTQGEERRYQELLEQALQQEMESMIAIQNMKDTMAFIHSQLSTLDSSSVAPDIAESQGNFEGPPPTPLSLPLSDTSDEGQYPFEWPVNPERGISAYFRDPTYPKRWGTHQAVDIRQPQGTPIHAPANAYVFQTKDNGMGYSYIILAHKGNLVTVYGHVSEIVVKAGTVLKKGDIIGFTGGMPGTKGAGLQTTGPHLHFEVYKNGNHINPLDVLPVYQLPVEFIPEEYLKKL